MIDLYFSNGKAYVWNAEDWQKLRKDHRIIGELIGTIAPFPRHSGFLGFPMVLMSEEAVLLVEKQICKLVEIVDIDKPPTEEIEKLYEDTEKKILMEQLECLKDRRMEQLSTKIDLIFAGKMKKLRAQGKSPDFSREDLIAEERSKVQPPSSSNILVQIPNEYPWPCETRELDISKLNPDVSSPENKLRYEVFKDLWNRGHYVTAGTKFGGDFLVYLGDPVKFHACYIVKCVNDYEQQLRISDIVAFGRLGVSVNKLTVLAYKSGDDGELCYQTVQWHETMY